MEASDIVALILLAIVALAAAFALANWLLDPVGTLHPRKKRPPMNTRRGKLILLRAQARRTPPRALLLGSSRIFNMMPEHTGLPQPAFNLSVGGAQTEDYLALWRLAGKTLAEPPAAALIACEPLAFHPGRMPDWECFSVPKYLAELDAIGARPKGGWWHFKQFFSLGLFRQGVRQAQLDARARAGHAQHRFHWHEDGRGEWLLGSEHASVRKLHRQVRNNPLIKPGPDGMRSIGEQRLDWLGKTLEEMQQSGCRALVFIPPEHPDLKHALETHARMPVYAELARRLGEMCRAHGMEFRDWHDAAALGLTPDDFRDTIHFTDDGMRKLEAAVSSHWPVASNE